MALPLARPAIAVGVTLALMECLNDFGTVDFFAVRTLTAGVFDVWLRMGNAGGAAQIALVMLGFVVLLIWAERRSRARQRFHHTSSKLRPIEGIALRGGRAWAATAACTLPILLGFAVPVSILADYAFTTISPQLGAVTTDGGITSFVVADIPGLIEGAHENRGLGHNFLRHVERCAAFVYVVDLGAGVGGRPGVRPWNALQTLMAELDAYLPGLSARPAIVVGTKSDLPHSSRAAETLRRKTNLPVVTVSAHESLGIQDVMSAADGLLHQTQRGRDAFEY